MKLSLVVPCYNEAENVAAFQAAVIGAFENCGYDYEIVFVNDGSRDATLHNLKKLHAAQKCPVKVVSFSRNFGKEAGIYAGMQHAVGESSGRCANVHADAAIQREVPQIHGLFQLQSASAYVWTDIFLYGDFCVFINHIACFIALLTVYINDAGHDGSFCTLTGLIKTLFYQ